jgi:hypothetical protein
MGGRLRLVAALGLVALAVLVSAASAAVPGKPQAGKVLLGVVGPDPDGFDRLTGKHHVLHVDKLYAYGKPYLVAEWALEAEDDVEFARRMFAWVATHPRTIGLVYFNKGWSGGSGVYELRSKPHGLALYRTSIKNARYLGSLP